MGDQYVKGTGGNIGLKRMNFGKSVNGEHGYVDCTNSNSMMGGQYDMVPKSVVGEQYVNESGGSVGLKRKRSLKQSIHRGLEAKHPSRSLKQSFNRGHRTKAALEADHPSRPSKQNIHRGHRDKTTVEAKHPSRPPRQSTHHGHRRHTEQRAKERTGR